MENMVVLSDNLSYLKSCPDNLVDLVYVDPPFNTGRSRKRPIVKSIESKGGLKGFGGKEYASKITGFVPDFSDNYLDFLEFIVPRLKEIHRVLKDEGSIYVHLDYREVHYVKIELDKIFGRENFINEIVWSYDFGAKSKKRWSAKHDNILFYAKNKNSYTFNFDCIPRIPYLAPALAGPEKAKKGKIVTDVWTETIVPTNSKEKQNYPTQKPLRILNRIVEVSSNPGDICMDFFAGSGSFGEACFSRGRKCILVDSSQDAFNIMKKRFTKYTDIRYIQ